MAGFGGGSAYSALLVLHGADHHAIPILALTCNLVVVTGGVVHYVRTGNLKFHLIMPFALTSVPMAVVGGSISVSEEVFRIVLGSALVLSGLMMWRPATKPRIRWHGNRVQWSVALPIGAVLGLIAGITGIGGGIFLAPLLHLLEWAESRVIAATSSAFILLNSLAALLAHLSTWPKAYNVEPGLFLWIPLMVFLGGQVGSMLGVGRFGDRLVRSVTMVLVLYVGVGMLVGMQ